MEITGIHAPAPRPKKSKEKYCCDGQEVLFPAAILKKQPAFTDKNPQGNTAHHEPPARAIVCGGIFAWQHSTICIKA